jgi:hypothetical protein
MEYAAMRRGIKLLAASCLIVFAAGQAKADTIYLSGHDGSTGELMTFNTATDVYGSAITTSDKLATLGFTTAGILYGTASDPKLYTVDTTSGNLTAIGSVGLSLTGLGGDSTGLLYGAKDNQLYTVSTSTGVAAATSNTISATYDYNPVGDLTTFGGVTYLTAKQTVASGGNGDFFLLTVDLSTGEATSAVDMGSGSSYNFIGLASGANNLGVQHLYAFTSDGSVYTLNPTTGLETSVAPTGFNSSITLDDAASLPTGSLNPNAVPEPSSLILCGIAGLMGLGYYRRRGKRNAA